MDTRILLGVQMNFFVLVDFCGKAFRASFADSPRCNVSCAGWHFPFGDVWTFPFATDKLQQSEQTGRFHMELWTKNRAPGGEDWESETWGGLFFLFFSLSLCPSWHRNRLVGRKRESGGKTNDEKSLLYPCAFIKYMERTREPHLDSIRVPLMASSVLFPDQGAASYGMSMAARSPKSTPAIWTHDPPHPTHTHTTSTNQLPPFLHPFTPTTSPTRLTYSAVNTETFYFSRFIRRL